MRKSFLINGILAVLILMLCGGTLFAATPLAAIRDSNNRVKAVLDENKGKKLDAVTEERLKVLISQATDFSAMSDAVLTVFPDTITAAQRAAFKRSFEELLLLSSVKKMGRYSADRFEYGAERVQGSSATVNTVAIYTKNDGRVDRVRLDYALELKNGRWMIVNYFMDGISTIRNYQQQFRSLIRARGIDGVIQHVQRTVERYRIED
jgi:ABC-type transporter MlaC component